MQNNENAVVYFVDRHLEEGRGEKVAFREADGDKRVLTYGGLAEEAGRFAGALYRHGVRREERVAMIVRDQIEFPVVFWGAMKAGAIPVPLNTLLSSTVYEAILNDSRASILVVSEQLWDVVKPAIDGNRYLRAVVVIGAAAEGTESYSAFVEGAPVEDTVEAHGDELAFWLYSSGSTGTPKGVRHVHSSLKATSDTFGQKVLGVTEEDVVHSVAKFFFAYGLGNAMSFPMAVGATTVIYGGRPTPDSVFALMAEERPTIFCGVPTLYAALVAEQEKRGGKPDHAIRICTSAGRRCRGMSGSGGKSSGGRRSLTASARPRCCISS
ncbi:AMP-binding protein [Rhodobacteraceae bacterium D3-12]|nr:AMP-binding protein [Rhodobacteraceae bacterium D3-12]